MMGSTHAATGATAGFVATAAYLTFTGQDPTFAHLTAGTLVGAGAALLPDLDHPNATATHSLGPVTRLLSLILRWISKAVYKATGTKYDTEEGEHRALTHTLVFAVVVGVLVAWAATRWEPVTFAVLWFTISLAARGAIAHFQPGVRQRDFRTLIGVGIAAAVISAVLVWSGEVSAPYLGAALALGMAVHVLGDMMTKERAPFLWPAKINGKRWWDLGLPLWACITTGDDSRVEKAFRWGGWAIPALGTVLIFVG